MAVNPAVQAFADKVNASLTKFGNDLDAFVAEVKALNDQIQALQNAPGVLSADDQTTLDNISTNAAALAARADALVPPPPITPPGA